MSRKLACLAMAFGCLTATVCRAQNAADREVIGNVPGQGMSVRPRSPEPTTTVRQKSPNAGQDSKQQRQRSESVFVGVMGQVFVPGVFEFADNAPNLRALIGAAGGQTNFASGEYYVLSAVRPLTKIDPNRNPNARFTNGDVLIVETSARIYRDPARTAKTQVALLNVTGRPVIFSRLGREQARLSSLLSMLGQTPRAAVGLRTVEPPNARQIPAAPDSPELIASGTSLIFDPAALDRAKLPSNWPPALLVAENSPIRQVSHQGSAPPLPPPPDDIASPNSPQQVAEADAWRLPPIPLDDSSQGFPLDPPAGFTQIEPLQTRNEPTSDATAEFPRGDSERNANLSETDRGELPQEIDFGAESISPEPEKHAPLSSQQRSYVIGFFVIIGLFGIAYWVRQRTAAYGYAGRKLAYSMNRDGSATESEPANVPAKTVHITPKAEPLANVAIPREEATEQRDESHAEPRTEEVETVSAAVESTPAPIVPLEVPEVAVRLPEIERISIAPPEPVEEPIAKPIAEPVASPECEPAAEASESLAAEFAAAAESALDRELFEKLIEGRLKIEREPAEPAAFRSESPSASIPAPESNSNEVDEETTAPRAVPQSIEPQPLFPIIWNKTTQPEIEPAKLRRFIPEPAIDEAAILESPAVVPEPAAELPEPADEMRPDAILPERVDAAEPAVPRPKMLDRGAKQRGALLDRVLQTVHRERNK